ncbi:hypothetical protein Gotri_018518 [Gossypium trilobum]|uniref:RNase H type-1 domain-containing protein n=1 Tax=Gossypium trilobum TaxID=34281 RepID=A0A7J9EA92_9ROSI|nr:hypothetical protein [Gossypium trilobum]
MGIPTGSFTLKSAYWKLSKRSWDPKDVAWRIPQAKWQEASSVIPWKDSWVQLNVNGAVEVEFGFTALGSMEDVKAIQMFTKTSSNSALIRRIQQLLMKVGNWLLQYVPRYSNKDADCIAKMAFDRENDLIIMEESPREIPHILS